MPSRGQQAAKFALLEALDNFSPLRNGLSRIAASRGDWAGIPMPIEGERLIIEPKYPAADKLAEIGLPVEEASPPDVTLRNCWWSDRLRCEIWIWNDGGKVCWTRLPHRHNFRHIIGTLACSSAWGIEQEHNALNLLGTLIPHYKFKQYLLTGVFMEKSERSGLTYLFRKLRPTIVIDARNEREGVNARILCALCLHPIAYYSNSWAGAMCPTDDVIAHLMLMRGDEHMLWRRSNQHEFDRPEAGL